MNKRRVRTLIPIVVLVTFAISAPVHAWFNSEDTPNPETLQRHPRSFALADAHFESAADAHFESAAVLPATAQGLALAMGVPAGDLADASLGLSDTRAAGIGDADLSYFPRQGSTFAILATGWAASADTPNDKDNLSTQLDGLDNSMGWDLVQLTLDLNVPADKNCLSFNFAFYSEEFDEFVGYEYNDTFTAELGGTNIDINDYQVVSPLNFAFDAYGSLISVNTVAGVSGNTGTTYDGATPLLIAKTPVTPGSSIQLVFSIQDLGDSGYDSAAFLDNFQWLDDSVCGAGSQVKPPLILVHGFQGLSDTDLNCDPNDFEPNHDIVRFSQVRDTPTTAVSYWGPLASWFEDNVQYGYDVWVAQLKTGAVQGTPSLWYNVGCLIDQINYVYRQNSQPITLVAHDMGGLVSRAALTDPVAQTKVRALYTTASPNAGLSASTINQLLGQDCANGGGIYTGVCNMESNLMVDFNTIAVNLSQIEYTFIGGDASPAVNIYSGSGPHDGMLGGYSAVGWLDTGDFLPVDWAASSPPRQLWTDEVHSGSFAGNNPMNYRSDGTGFSQTYSCILAAAHALPMPGFCRMPQQPAVTNAPEDFNQVNSTQFTQVLSGSIHGGETVVRSLNVDTSAASQFHLSWTAGTLALTLTDPNGREIDPEYAALHPDEVAYQFLPGGADLLPQASYIFTNTIPGKWQLNLQVNDTGGESSDYNAFAGLETDRTLTFHSDKDLYTSGETALMTANLQKNLVDLSGASVSAILAHSDGMTETITLADQGNGSYSAEYTVPDVPGFLAMRVNAQGIDGGTIFSRHADALAFIETNVLELSGPYEGQPRNENGDALFEAYDLAVEVSATQPLKATFVANLAANGSVIATAYQEVGLSAGKQTVLLQFGGDDIRRSQQDGPYTVTRLSVIDTALGVPVYSLENVLETGPYAWKEFGGCHSLSVSVLPDLAGRIQADPAPNCSSGTLYSTGAQVELTAVPNWGYMFANWIVDASGAANPVQVVVDQDRRVVGNFVAGTQGSNFLPIVQK